MAKPWEQFAVQEEERPPWEEFTSEAVQAPVTAPWEEFRGEVGVQEEVPLEEPTEAPMTMADLVPRQPTEEELQAAYADSALVGAATVPEVTTEDGQTISEFLKGNDLVRLGSYLRYWAGSTSEERAEQRDLQTLLDEQVMQEGRTATISSIVDDTLGGRGTVERINELEDTSLIREGGLTAEEEAEYEGLTREYGDAVSQIGQMYDAEMERQGGVAGALSAMADAADIIDAFDYTGDTVGGAADSDKDGVYLCEGDGGATQAKTLFTIKKLTTVAFTCIPAVENNV